MAEEKPTTTEEVTQDPDNQVERVFGGESTEEKGQIETGVEREPKPEMKEDHEREEGPQDTKEEEVVQEEQVDVTEQESQEPSAQQVREKRERDVAYERIKEAFIQSLKEDIYENVNVFDKLPKAKRVEAKRRFGKQATQTAQDIREMIRSGSLSYKKAFFIIDDWLKSIRKDDPEVSEFYLLQEAKKLTDDVRDIAREHKTQMEEETIA